MCDEGRSKTPSGLERLAVLAAIWACAVSIRVILPNSAPILALAGLASALLLLAWAFPARARAVGEFCFRYRWLLALLVFCLCVCLRLHGSSIGVYDGILPTQIEQGETTLFGEPRGIRSDEFGVATMKYFSQEANNYKLYSRQMSLSPTNMLLDYYSPAWDWTVIGKPLNWGFLLFGNEIGLSWYWCMEILLLFMTAFEMCLILTAGRRRESLLGAFLIALSPEIQWWVMPHMPPLILYAMALFVVGYGFFTARTPLAGWAFAALAVIATTGFALSIFPSFQIPCAYIVLVLLCACLVRDRERITFTRKAWPRLLFASGATLAILVPFVLRSAGDFSLLMNTVYPGRRVALGNDGRVVDLFTDLTSLFLPYKNINYLNNCEVSSYIHFAPFFILLAPKMLARMKRSGDRNALIGKTLLWILLAEIVFMLVGIPRLAAELTLLRFCNRMGAIYDWTAAIFTVWGFSVLLRYDNILTGKEKILWPLAYGAFYLLLINEESRAYFAQVQIRGITLGWLLIAFALAAFITILLLAVYRRKRLLTAAVALLMVFCGATVNPVERGIGAVTNHPISAAVSEIAAQEPESCWLCTDCTFILSNFLIANGARVLDATNYYPDPQKWSILDPTGENTGTTNRYANLSAVLTEEDTTLVANADLIEMRLNPENLKGLGIRFLFTPVDPSELLARHGIHCEYVTGQDGYGIYRLDYQE